MRARPDLRPNPYLLVVVLFWGFNFVAVKEAYRTLTPPSLALIRYLVMWVGLVIVCVWRRESLKYPKGDAGRLLYLGFMSMGVYMLFFLEGMRSSGAMEGSIIFQLSPVFTAFLAPAFRQERFSPGAVLGGAIALGGIALIAYHPAAGQQNLILGNLIVLFAALLWAYCVVLMKPLLGKYSPLRVLTLSMPGALPVMLAYGVAPALHEPWAKVGWYGWAMFAHIAILSGIVAFLLFYEGVRKVGATGATIYQFLVPVASMVCAVLIEGVRPGILQFAGFVIVLAGVGYASRARYLAQQREVDDWLKEGHPLPVAGPGQPVK